MAKVIGGVESAFTKLKGIWRFFWTLFTYLFGIDRIVKLQRTIRNYFLKQTIFLIFQASFRSDGSGAVF